MGRVTDLVFVMWFKMVMDWRVWIMMVYMMNWVWVLRWRMWLWMRMVRLMLVRVRVRIRLVGIEDMFMMLMKNTFRMLMVFMMSMFRITNGSLANWMIWYGFRMMMRFVMINMIKMSMGNILSSFWIDWWQRSLCNLIDSMNDFCSIRRIIVI